MAKIVLVRLIFSRSFEILAQILQVAVGNDLDHLLTIY